jgi:hypothetical protein
MPVPTIFTALAVIFVALTVRDLLRSQGLLDARRATWLRMAMILSGIGIALVALPLLR